MPIEYKVLGQSAPTAATQSMLYAVPSGKAAVCSTLVACNRGVSTLFRVAVQPLGDSLSDQHYIVYDAILEAGESAFLTLGVTLATTDEVTVYAGTGNLSFSLFGSEIPFSAEEEEFPA